MYARLGSRLFKFLGIFLLIFVASSLSAQPAAAQSAGVLSISVTAAAPSVNTGGPVGYTVTLSNSGATSIAGLVIDMPLPDTGNIWVIDAISNTLPAGTTCDLAGTPQTLHCVLGQVDPLTQDSILVTSTAGPATACLVLNGAATLSGTGGSSVISNTATIAVNCPDMSVSVITSTPAPNTGDPVDLEFYVLNNGGSIATNVVIDMPLPDTGGQPWVIVTKSPNINSFGTCTLSGTPQTLHCTIPSIAQQEPTLVKVSSNVTPADACLTFSAAATLTATNLAPITSPTTRIQVSCPNLTLSVTASTHNANAGDPVSFVFHVNNIGGSIATNVVMDMPLPDSGQPWVITGKSPNINSFGTCTVTGSPQTLHCTIPSIAQQEPTLVQVTSTATAVRCTRLDAALSLSATNVGPLTSPASSIFVSCPAVFVDMTTSASTVDIGSLYAINYKVVNTTTSTITNLVLISDIPDIGISGGLGANLPQGFTCQVSGNFTWQCNVPALPPYEPGQAFAISGEAIAPPRVTCKGFGASTTLNADQVPQTNSGFVRIQFTCPNLVPAVTTTTAAVNVGDPINLKFSLTNSGPSPATNVVVDLQLPPNGGQAWNFDPAENPIPTNCTLPGVDNLPLHCTLPQLNSGETWRFVVQSTASSASACMTLNAAATVSALNVDPQASPPATIVVNCPDLTIAKHHTGSFYQGQKGLPYLLTVTNTGGAPTVGAVSAADSLPAGLTATAISGTGWTCALATLTCTRSDALAAGSSYPDITLLANVNNDAPASLTNGASISGGGEVNTANNTASDPTSIAQITGKITPATTTCAQFASNSAAVQNAVTYTVKSGKLRTVTPSTFIYYSKVIAPAASFQIKVNQSNPGGWPTLADPQIYLYDANCTRINTSIVAKGAVVTFNVTGATTGAVYYVSILYRADSILGRKVTTPYPSIPYTFTTSANNVLLNPNTTSISFTP